MTRTENLVTADWLATHLSDPDLVIADCRFDLTQPQAGRQAYTEAHIPGAVYFDLERDLSAPKQAHGGRHPLPPVDTFCRTVGAAGIDETVMVVAYDAQSTAMAARLWWMLRYLGHAQVRVLGGGWQAWRAAGHPVTQDVPRRAPRTFAPRIRARSAVDLAELRRLQKAGARLVDSRAPERYRGEVEPLDPVAGHIPGAVNLPYTDTLDARGNLRSPADLRDRFAGIAAGRGDLVVYCGSGVTACVNLLAMEEAGIEGARLYVGGWSDWCSYPENPVATAKKSP